MVSVAHKHVSDQLVALNADIVGYSKLLADDLETTTSVVEAYHRLVAEKIEEHGGTLVNFVGDNFMAVFEMATNAMATAISISSEIEVMNADIPRQKHVRFRMGLDQGVVVSAEDGQYFGDALNVAARIQAIAQPGGVSVSGSVYQALDQPELRFRSIGRQGLKNIPEQVEVFQFADLPSDGDVPSTSNGLSLESPTVVVFPVHAELADPEVASAAQMIRSDLVHNLASIPNLNVVDADDIDRTTLDVAAGYFLDSGIHQIGDKVIVYAKVVDASTWNVFSSHKWTSTKAELFSLSDTISSDVSRSIQIELIIGEPARIYADIGDPEALQKVYAGWFHLTTGTREGWAKALDIFKAVAESHPNEPFGHVLAAFTNWAGAAEGYSREPEVLLKEAWAGAQKGIEMGDPTGLAKTIEAAILMAKGQGDQALELIDGMDIQRPTCDVTFAVEGSVRRYLGQWEESVDLLDTAMRLTAVNKPWYPTVQACSLYMGGRLEQAASTAEAVLAYQPHNLEALLILAAAQAEQGMDRRAHATAEQIRERYPSVDINQWLDTKPYQVPEMVDRWKRNLAKAGVIEAAAD